MNQDNDISWVTLIEIPEKLNVAHVLWLSNWSILTKAADKYWL